MFTKNALIGLVSIALAATSVPRGALADGKDFALGVVTGVIGSHVVRQSQKPKTVYRTTTRRSTVNSYQRQQNREVQTALNYFGFNAGVADGVLGRNSRSAISGYQAFMAYPVTGSLTEYERVFLVSSYQRAVIGGPQAAELIAARGLGTRGLLHAYRDEQMGVTAAAPAPVVPAPAPVQPVEVVTPTPQAVQPLETETASAGTGGKLPNFLSTATAVSIASHCNRVSLATSTNGGYMTASALTDPQQALGEQFCLARTYAIEQGESLAATVQGASMAEMKEQCEAFAPTMFEYQARIASQSAAEAGAALQDFVVTTGAPPAQLSANARICLSIGYRTDNAELALASAMILVGLGEAAYGELLGHHLLNGFATAKRTDRANEWLELAVTSLEAGASPLVAANSAGRTALLRTALETSTGATPGPVLQDAAANTGGGFVLPGVNASAN